MKEKTVYIAPDKKEFSNKEECESYEFDLIDKSSTCKVFKVSCTPDSTGAYCKHIFLKFDYKVHTVSAYNLAVDYCIYFLGSPVKKGTGNILNSWSISESDIIEYISALDTGLSECRSLRLHTDIGPVYDYSSF